MSLSTMVNIFSNLSLLYQSVVFSSLLALFISIDSLVNLSERFIFIDSLVDLSEFFIFIDPLFYFF